jgi:hypothetical protein
LDPANYLTDILINGLDSWFHGSTLSPSCYPRQYTQLILEQSAIGWHHLFNGHVTNRGQIKQDYFLRHQKITINASNAKKSPPTHTPVQHGWPGCCQSFGPNCFIYGK